MIGDWVEVPLSSGAFAKIDREDAEKILPYKWGLLRAGRGYLYAARTIRAGGKQVTLLMHRVLMNAPEGSLVDHRNHDTIDNRKQNLRVCSRTENNRHSRKRRRPDMTSRFKGVSFKAARAHHKNPYIAYFQRRYLGSFPTEELAARAYNEAVKKHHGEFAWLNTIP